MANTPNIKREDLGRGNYEIGVRPGGEVVSINRAANAAEPGSRREAQNPPPAGRTDGRRTAVAG